MNNLSWKCLTNPAACRAFVALLTSCDAVQHRSAVSDTTSRSDFAAQEEAAMDMPGMALSEARLDDVEMRHFAAYRSYVAVAGTSNLADDPHSNTDTIRRVSEELPNSSAAYLVCATRSGM